MCKGYLSIGYSYGFNGQEKVDEIAGVGNHNTALFWEYDTRLGRRWNVDPKGGVDKSKYSCLGDNPIANIDKPGDDFWYFNADGKLLTVIKTVTDVDVVYKVNNDNTVSHVMQCVTPTQTNTDLATGNTCRVWDMASITEKSVSLWISANNKNSGDYRSLDGVKPLPACGVTINENGGGSRRTIECGNACVFQDYATLALQVGTLPTPNAGDAPVPISVATQFQSNLQSTTYCYQGASGTTTNTVIITTATYTDANGKMVPTTSNTSVSPKLKVADASRDSTLPTQTPDNTCD
jgi:hypothetical protein